MQRTLAVLALLCAGAFAAPKPETAIRSLLDSQVASWNHGDLESYMAGYWNSPELVFQSGATQTRGWQPTLERYRQRYQQGGHTMGRLGFDHLEMVMLGSEAALARGRFTLAMPDGSHSEGLFTLILRKFPEGWRIIHDHTCVAQK
jgi:beta-aspartyl-peptidase (threonine type)